MNSRIFQEKLAMVLGYGVEDSEAVESYRTRPELGTMGRIQISEKCAKSIVPIGSASASKTLGG